MNPPKYKTSWIPIIPVNDIRWEVTNSHLKMREGKIQKMAPICNYMDKPSQWSLQVPSRVFWQLRGLTEPHISFQTLFQMGVSKSPGWVWREETVLSPGTGSCTSSEMCHYQDTYFSGSVAYEGGFALQWSWWSMPHQGLLGKCWPLNIVLLDLFLLCLSFVDSV